MTIKNKNLLILVENLSKCFNGKDRLFPYWFIDDMQNNFAILYDKASAVRAAAPASAEEQEKYLEETTDIDNIIFIKFSEIKDINLTFDEAKWLKHFIQRGE